MPDQNKSLRRKEAFSKALGLNLADEIAAKLLEGEGLSLEQMSKYHSLTEIGTAFIRIDALCVAHEEGPGLICIDFPGGKKCCFRELQTPPDEG